MGFIQRVLLPPFSSRRALDFGAATLCLLGLVVMLGWFWRLRSLIQLHSQFVPMQFNTALGFTLLGLTLGALNHQRKAIATSCAAIVFLIGFLTLTQYLFDVDLLIDELLMKHYIVKATSHPGRMAPNTALNFCLSSFSILLMGRSRLKWPYLFAASILGSLVAGLGMVAALGYLSQVETAYGWGKFTHMALHTSIGFILTGMLIIVMVKRLNLRIFRRSPIFFLPTTISILSITVTIGFWQALRASELSIEAKYNVPDSNFIAEALLVGGLLLSVVLAIAVLYAERFKNQVEILKAAKYQITQLNNRLEKLSYLDSLTGIPNRRFFDLNLEKEWGRAYREKRPIALIFIDIDYFKLYNDYYGHPEGDRCLQQVAEMINRTARRTTDLAARYGGEEFVILLPGTTLEAAQDIAQKTLDCVRELRIPHHTSPVSSVVTFSAGVHACIPENQLAITAFIKKTDDALYQAKKISRNRVVAVPSF
ncbi:MAG: diguanylate cyclase [Limnothrix sp.]